MYAVADTIKKARNIAGLSQDRLAAAAQLSKGAIQSIETGKTLKPNASTLVAIARALGFERWDEVVASVEEPVRTARGVNDNPLINDAIHRQIEAMAQEYGASEQQVINRAIVFLANQPDVVREAMLREQPETAGRIEPRPAKQRYAAKAKSGYSSGQKPVGFSPPPKK